VRVLFVDFDGVLHAVAGPPSTMRLFVWAPVLDALLNEHPDVKLVVHASARDHTPIETIVVQLGKLGERVKCAATPRLPRWEAIQRHVIANAEISDYRILDDSQQEFPAELPELILCAPNRGVSDPAVQQKIRDWLQAEKRVV